MRRSGPLHEQSTYAAAPLCTRMVCQMGIDALHVALLVARTSPTVPALAFSKPAESKAALVQVMSKLAQWVLAACIY